MTRALPWRESGFVHSPGLSREIPDSDQLEEEPFFHVTKGTAENHQAEICSHHGHRSKVWNKREHEKSFNRPRARQNKQDAENSTGRRSCSKTDCKASMHVKRRPDGKWVIHSFVKEHNHELLPAQAVSEQTRKMYAAMARQFAEYKTVVGLKNEKSPFDKGGIWA
ncbi:hypothetical protein K1719_013721 [Acacia pycnantha]|nr:hypothetical protein K1719_013721 [Acacia pycnantha]